MPTVVLAVVDLDEEGNFPLEAIAADYNLRRRLKKLEKSLLKP